MENNHHEKVTELAVTLLERMAKNQLEEDLHDDLRVVGLGLVVYLITYYVHVRTSITHFQPLT